MSRDYETITAALIQRLGSGADDEQRMRAVVDLLWGHLHDHGVSWVGFYLFDAEHDEMILGPSRDKPACSPIGMHGACGQAFRNRRPLIVRDVKELGEGYVACDPKDQSEIVIPVRDTTGKPIGVLDLDSFALGAFDESDATGLARVLSDAGLLAE